MRIHDTTRIIRYPIFSRETPEFMMDSFIVHPATSIELVKAFDMRSPAPATMLRLRTMWLAGLGGGTLLHDPTCFVCDAATSGIATCPLCLTTAHSSCIASLVSEFGGAEHVLTPRIPRVEISHWLSMPTTDCSTCLWCWQHAVEPS